MKVDASKENAGMKVDASKKMLAWCQTTLKGRAGQAPSWDLHVCLNNIDRGSWSDFVNQMQRFE